MKINELEKIVNDGLVKYKAYKDAGDALSQVKSLVQATEDLGKTVSGLEKDRDALLSEVSKISEKIKDAQEKADGIISAANKRAEVDYERHLNQVKLEQEKASKKLEATNAAIAEKQGEYEEALRIKAENEKTRAELQAEQAKLDKVKQDLMNIMNVKG